MKDIVHGPGWRQLQAGSVAADHGGDDKRTEEAGEELAPSLAVQPEILAAEEDRLARSEGVRTSAQVGVGGLTVHSSQAELLGLLKCRLHILQHIFQSWNGEIRQIIQGVRHRSAGVSTIDKEKGGEAR